MRLWSPRGRKALEDLKINSFSDEIKIDSPDQPGKAQIISFTVWGILRGMESFGHLIYYSTFTGTHRPTVISNKYLFTISLCLLKFLIVCQEQGRLCAGCLTTNPLSCINLFSKSLHISILFLPLILIPRWFEVMPIQFKKFSSHFWRIGWISKDRNFFIHLMFLLLECWSFIFSMM